MKIKFYSLDVNGNDIWNTMTDIGFITDYKIMYGLDITQDWWKKLKPFIIHPIIDRFNYHVLRENYLIGDFDTLEDAQVFFKNATAVFVDTIIRKYDYFLIAQKAHLDVDDISEKVNDISNNSRHISNTNDGYIVDEISPINATLGYEINTPNHKSKNHLTANNNDEFEGSNIKSITSLDRIKEFMKTSEMQEIEKECHRFIDSLVVEYTTIF